MRKKFMLQMQYFLRCNGCALIVAVPREVVCEDGGLYIFAKGFLPIHV